MNEIETIEEKYSAALKALQQIVDMNRQTALHQYGDSEKAESWACVIAARSVLNKEKK